MAFSFNFGGDDIDADLDVDEDQTLGGLEQSAEVGAQDVPGPNVEVKSHDLREWLSLLPSSISYTTTTITSPLGRALPLPHRALFDIRTQLMAEDDSSTLSFLSTSDLTTGLYEGGFKTWECSLDLCSLLLDRGPRKDIDELAQVEHVVELGAGSALPTLVLFQHAVRNAFSTRFTVADYNADVLRLVTVPNLLLAYARFGGGGGNGVGMGMGEEEGELEVTGELVEGFLGRLGEVGISISLLSGPWGEDLGALIPESSLDLGTLVLAAETVYSPASTVAFVDLLVGILKKTKMAKGIVAAKRMYFGVGGSVDGLKEACRDRGAVAYEVENSGVQGMEKGVGRALVEVQMF